MTDQQGSSTANGSHDAPASKIRHEWCGWTADWEPVVSNDVSQNRYQTDSEVNISVFVKNVKAEDLKIDLHSRALSLTVRLPTGSDLVFDLDPLAHDIDTATSSHRILSTKIEIRLAKVNVGMKWNKLEGEDQAAGAMTGTSSSATRTGFSKRNWDKIGREAAEEDSKSADLGKDPNAGGDKELNKLFQKLYADATPDQRRAMMKSYQESNGTSLSTNWEDVSKKKVETMPPDSMVAKPWNA